jgi:hypothetical protein
MGIIKRLKNKLKNRARKTTAKVDAFKGPAGVKGPVLAGGLEGHSQAVLKQFRRDKRQDTFVTVKKNYREIMSGQPITDEDAVAAADKEMEERANRAKELLSQRYVGLKRAQVCRRPLFLFLFTRRRDTFSHCSPRFRH